MKAIFRGAAGSAGGGAHAADRRVATTDAVCVLGAGGQVVGIVTGSDMIAQLAR